MMTLTQVQQHITVCTPHPLSHIRSHSHTMPPAINNNNNNNNNDAAAAVPQSSQSNQAWFLGAPWTKLSCLVFILVQVLQQQHTLPAFLQILQFDSTGDFVVGLAFLAMQLRRLERELGSRQMGEFFLLLILLPSILQIVIFPVLLALDNDDDSHKVQLSVLLIASTTYWYTLYTPRLHPNFISFGGIRFSEKALTQLWGLYLMGHSASTNTNNSMVNIASGILTSALYFGFAHQLEIVPNAVMNKIPWDALGSLFLLDPPPKLYAPLLMMGQQQQPPPQQRPTAPPRPAREAAVAAVPPPQEAIDQLTAMGFDEDRVRQALQQSNNNVERAADRLLMG
jgi:hypothetical protein